MGGKCWPPHPHTSTKCCLLMSLQTHLLSRWTLPLRHKDTKILSCYYICKEYMYNWYNHGKVYVNQTIPIAEGCLFWTLPNPAWARWASRSTPRVGPRLLNSGPPETAAAPDSPRSICPTGRRGSPLRSRRWRSVPPPQGFLWTVPPTDERKF